MQISAVAALNRKLAERQRRMVDLAVELMKPSATFQAIQTCFFLTHSTSPLLNARVAIFLKAKIGTLVGEFSRDEICGPLNLLFTKSGTLRCGSRLDSRSKVRDAKSERKIGVISKKKKDHHHLGCTVYVNFKPLSV